MIPASAMALPHYGGHGCTALNIVPTDYVGGRLIDPAPADFNPRPGTTPGIPDLGRLDAVGLASVLRLPAIAVALCLLAGAAPARADAVLDRIRQAGVLACGMLSEPADYTEDDTHGALPALDRDICRAVAAAVLGDADRVRLAAYPDEQHGFAAIRAGQADLLLGASARLTAGPLFHIAFGRPVFLDGQSFLVERAAHIASPADLAGRQVCFLAGTPAADTVQAVLSARKIAFLPFPFREAGEMEAALVTGHCAAMAGDLSHLADARAQFHARAADFVILPQAISLDPIAPAWPDSDPQWGRIVDRAVSALLQAELEGVMQADAASAQTLARPGDLLPGDRAVAQVLGLAPGWSLRAVAAVGSYAELFRRDLGDASPLRLPRVPNALWTAGG